jgi:hypothetical protein
MGKNELDWGKQNPIEYKIKTIEGSLLLIVRSRREPIEEWLETIREKSGQKVEGSYPGGEAYISGEGNIAKIYAAIKENLTELNKRINDWNQSKYKLGEAVNYTVEDVDRWMEKQKASKPLKVRYYPG